MMLGRKKKTDDADSRKLGEAMARASTSPPPEELALELELGNSNRCLVCGAKSVIYEYAVGYFCNDHLRHERDENVE